jgi:ATP-dependent Lhr-like helicase
MIRIKDLPDKPKCPSCGSFKIGLLKVEEEKTQALVEKRGERLAKAEEKMQTHAKQTAELIERYGKAAAVALSARHISAADARAVLEKEKSLSDHFFELVLETERKVLAKRFR